MITKEMVRDGIQSGIIRFAVDPNMEGGTVCEIGDDWFYFGGVTAESMEPKEYLKVVPQEDIINEVFATLHDFNKERHTFGNEYDYIEAYLKERTAGYMDTLEERDRKLEQLWKELEDVPMNPDTEEMEEEFLHFPEGTNREEIWEWFDERHSKGVAYLMHIGEAKDREVAKALHLISLCTECDSEYCAFNPEGICKLPFVTGKEPGLGDDGCADFCYNEKGGMTNGYK